MTAKMLFDFYRKLFLPDRPPNVTGRRRGARILTLTFTRKHSMLIQHGGQHEPRAILFPTIPSVTTRGWGG